MIINGNEIDTKTLEILASIFQSVSSGSKSAGCENKKKRSCKSRNLTKFLDRDKYNELFGFGCDEKTGEILEGINGKEKEARFLRFYRAVLILFHHYSNNNTGNKEKYVVTAIPMHDLSDFEYEIFGKLCGNIVDLIYDAVQEVQGGSQNEKK